jgi:hypothetical protein
MIVQRLTAMGGKECLFVQVVAQQAADGRVAQAVEGLGLDLADAPARHAHLAPSLLEGVGLPVGQAELFSLLEIGGF